MEGKYFLTKSDEIKFLDPVFSTVLNPAEPPPSVLQDPLASQGIEQLHRLAAEQRLLIQLIQAPHGGAEDYRDIVRDYGKILRSATLIGVETHWRSATHQPPELASLEYIFDALPHRLAFQEAQRDWLTQQDKLTLPCEYPSGYQSELKKNFDQLVELCWQVKPQDSKLAIVLYGAYQTTRQWLFLAQLGYWLHHLELIEKLPAGEIKILLMLGGHKSIELKINDYFTIPTEHYFVTNRTLGKVKAGKDYYSVFDDMTSQARVTKTQLESDFWYD